MVNVHIYPRVLFSRSVHLSVKSLSLSLSSATLLLPLNNLSSFSNKEKKVITHIHFIFFTMGKLLCDSTTVAAEPFQGSPASALPWIDSKSPTTQMDTIGTTVDLVVPVNLSSDAFTGGCWEDVVGLEDIQRRHLQRLHAKGVLWKPPASEDSSPSDLRSVVFRLSHGGEVESDGNCLFTASRKAMEMEDVNAKELRRRTVKRFLEDYGSVSFEEGEAIDDAIRHMYSPDLMFGWGIHVVQEVKLLAKKEDRFSLDSAIDELVHLGMQRYNFFDRFCIILNVVHLNRK